MQVIPNNAYTQQTKALQSQQEKIVLNTTLLLLRLLFLDFLLSKDRSSLYIL